MEEENATQEDFDPNTINSVKAGLMGPLAGIGDSVFWGTLRPLAGGIACSLALTGNLFAPFLFLLLFNIPNVLVRYFGCHWGYNSGTQKIANFAARKTAFRKGGTAYEKRTWQTTTY